MIKAAESLAEKEQLDELLWQVLWKPLDLPRDIRTKFGLPGKKTIELIAVENKIVVGGLVAIWINENKLEIRHLAVEKDYQKRSIGTRLISNLFDLIKKNNPIRIQTYVRNTSFPFFVKCGFKQVNEQWIEHPDFERHGIRFKLVEKYI